MITKILVQLSSVLLLTISMRAGVLANAGQKSVLAHHISVCFVGDAATTQATFISEIRGFLAAHQAVANIDYEFLSACPAPTTDANGNDVYAGDLRVVLPGTSVPYSPPSSPTGIHIPGTGCTRLVPAALDKNGQPVLDASGNQTDSMASFGIFPFERTPEADTHCLWNMRLGSDGNASGPYRNHTLHEFGHSLGFAHEFDRSDAASAATAANCDPAIAGSWISGLPPLGQGNNGYTSESYDLSSTMNYTVQGCPGYVGNYSNAGLGELEKISLHFMYPEDQRVAEFIGKTLLVTQESSILRGLWEARGAAFTTHQMIKTYTWSEGNTVLSSAPYYVVGSSAAGTRRLTLTYVDYLDRSYTFNFTVRVLTPDAFARTIAGPVAASFSLFPQ